MKNQRAVYLLLPLVLLIWGLIGWRVWSAADEPADEPAQPTVVAQSPTTADSSRQPRLLLSYADPFRPVPGAPPVAAPVVVTYAAPALATPRVAASTGLNLPVRPATPAPAAVWPAISYLGVITHAEGKAQVALLTINGEETFSKVGRSVQGIQVLKLFRDSVQVVFNKQRRTLYRATGGK